MVKILYTVINDNIGTIRLCMLYNRWIIMFCALALPIFLSAQHSNYCTVVDSVTQEPVVYASINAGSFYIYSDAQGAFPIKDIPKEIVHISRIGYELLKISKSELKDTLFLAPLSYPLSEVVVSANKKTFEVGYHRFKTIGIAHGNQYQMAGVYISNPGESSEIVRVMVATRGNRQGMEYDILLFEATLKGEPGALIYSNKYTSPNGKNLMKILIENTSISIPEKGVVVALAWGASSENQDAETNYATIKVTEEFAESRSFMFKSNGWFKFDTSYLGYTTNYKIGLELQSE